MVTNPGGNRARSQSERVTTKTHKHSPAWFSYHPAIMHAGVGVPGGCVGVSVPVPPMAPETPGSLCTSSQTTCPSQQMTAGSEGQLQDPGAARPGLCYAAPSTLGCACALATLPISGNPLGACQPGQSLQVPATGSALPSAAPLPPASPGEREVRTEEGPDLWEHSAAGPWPPNLGLLSTERA